MTSGGSFTKVSISLSIFFSLRADIILSLFKLLHFLPEHLFLGSKFFSLFFGLLKQLLCLQIRLHLGQGGSQCITKLPDKFNLVGGISPREASSITPSTCCPG